VTIVDPEFEALLPALSDDDPRFLALVDSISSEGCRDPLVTWRGVLLDGHHRLRACAITDRPYMTTEIELPDRAAALAWIVTTQASRRNLSDDHTAALCVLSGVTLPEYLRATAGLTAQQIMRQPRGEEALRWMLEGPTRTLRSARNQAKRLRGEAVTRPRRRPEASPPRGPDATQHIPEGHELAGLSTLADAEGNATAAWHKTRVAGADEPPTPLPDDAHLVSTSVMQRGDGSIGVQWSSYDRAKADRDAAVREAMARHVAQYSGLAAPVPAPEHSDEDLCTLYPLGDPHIGMLAWAPEAGAHFDLHIATTELIKCVDLLVQGAPASKRAIVTNLGDFFHAQDDAARTPGHGNQLDLDGRFAKVLEAGYAILRRIIDLALTKHEVVEVRNLPGNHDPNMAHSIALWLRAVYERDPRVIVQDSVAALQYDVHGTCLFGWAHGDGAKPAELSAIMASDRPVDWGATTERVWHTGHVHHLSRKESPGCVVESHRTMAAKDAWHARRYRSGQSLCAITYHAQFGEVGRSTVNLARVRSALEAPQ